MSGRIPQTKGRNAGALDREIRARRSGDSGQSTPTVPPSQRAIREAIAAQMCPWCHRGPFVMLPVHTNKMHGVDKLELRDLAGLKKADPICSEDLLAKLSDAYDPTSDRAAKARAASIAKAKAGTRRKPRFTKAGLAKQTETITKWMREHPDEHRANSAAAAASLTPEQRSAAGRKAWASLTPEQREAFRQAAQTPEAVEKRRRAARKPAPAHGTEARYKRHRCRCDACRKAKSESRARRKAQP
jgi:primosomal protein N'